MTSFDFVSWLEVVRKLHGWDKDTALAELGVDPRAAENWTRPYSRGPGLTVALACAALARRNPLKPWSAADE
ncbi:hypothetical protein M446_4672 [Methylobacterium sp. 4-46]|uniref:hypothetical protein n=1 Tax=unclassified Methylobacterium TaxID=2615210 RepID=UPI000152CE8E|nr:MULTISPECIES: hypothetical protein [Methylobacterium]ACA19011.1 hypothetical protein M446_4672 [Methylobacterium sp. 4-46]WFT78225.1 hypothetical protein QA634_23485 [Methylobacterium nodulans]